MEWVKYCTHCEYPYIELADFIHHLKICNSMREEKDNGKRD